MGLKNYCRGHLNLVFHWYVPVPAAVVIEAGDAVVGFVGILRVVVVFVAKKSGRPDQTKMKLIKKLDLQGVFYFSCPLQK